jgi:hypothetical protein
MTWSRTLEVATQRFDKLTGTCGHILSYARQGPDIKNFIYYFLCVEFCWGHFEPIPVNNSQK